jgi:hypothetical protein
MIACGNFTGQEKEHCGANTPTESSKGRIHGGVISTLGLDGQRNLRATCGSFKTTD